MEFRCSQALPNSTEQPQSPLRTLESSTAPSPTSKTIPSPKKSSKRGSVTDLSRTHQSGLMCALSPEEGLEAMLRQLSEVSPASRSVSLASELAKRTSAIYLERLSESLLKLDASSSCWKTSQACLFQMSDSPTSPHQFQTYLDSWPKAALIVHGCLFPLPTLERPTAAVDGGVSVGEIWRTPCARDWHPSKPDPNRADAQVQLPHQVAKWQTPKVAAGGYTRDNGDPEKERLTLDGEVKQWCTPSAENFRTRGGDRADEMGLDNQVKNWATPQEHDHHVGDAERVGRFGTTAGGRNLTDEVMRHWPTPKLSDAKGIGDHGEGSAGLNTQVDNWGTPRADEYKGTGPKGTGPKGTVSQLHRLGKGYLDAQVEEIADAGRKNESLNPAWEEILMGWEIGWTDPVNVCAGMFPGFPMGQGNEQFNYEPPRTLPREQMTHRTGRIKACGNGIVPQCATAAYIQLLLNLLKGEGTNGCPI